MVPATLMPDKIVKVARDRSATLPLILQISYWSSYALHDTHVAKVEEHALIREEADAPLYDDTGIGNWRYCLPCLHLARGFLWLQKIEAPTNPQKPHHQNLKSNADLRNLLGVQLLSFPRGRSQCLHRRLFSGAQTILQRRKPSPYPKTVCA